MIESWVAVARSVGTRLIRWAPRVILRGVFDPIEVRNRILIFWETGGPHIRLGRGQSPRIEDVSFRLINLLPFPVCIYEIVWDVVNRNTEVLGILSDKREILIPALHWSAISLVDFCLDHHGAAIIEGHTSECISLTFRGTARIRSIAGDVEKYLSASTYGFLPRASSTTSVTAK